MKKWVFLLCAFTFSPHAGADIYAFVDANGVTHFSNVPSDARFEIVLEVVDEQDLPPIQPAVLDLSIRYNAMIEAAAKDTDVDANLLRAVIVVESGFDAAAISPAGAQGLMQLMPATARIYGVTDVFDPQQNILGGALYLRDLIDRYDDYKLVLAAYNAGEDAVARYGGNVPPYLETQNYVPKVLGIYNRLRHMSNTG